MTPNRRNFLIVAAILSAWTLLIIARLLQLQVVQHEAFTRQARRQQERTIEVSPVRGVVYDRNYHPLAMSVEVDSIFAVPGEIPNPSATARVLAPVLNLSEAELEKRLQGGRFFSWVKRKISEREASRVLQLNLAGIYSQKENKRFYPKRELAAHVLGYVGMDDKGLAGIEQSREKTIRGRPGELLIATDARQHWLGRAGKQPEPGQNLVLTIDENIQYVAERELATAVNQFHPLSASVIVQDSQTGEILAMANQPTFNPNTYAESTPEARSNLAVSASYEPGSTFKVVTVASALEENLTRPDEPIDCQMGSIVLAGHVIHDHQKYGILSVNEIIQNSSDVGAIKLALRLGDANMYRYMRSFGFGAPTGIELPGEARGLTKPPERWSKISIGAIAMGQEVGVTPLQIVSMASAVANGGWWVRPHIVREEAGAPQGDERDKRRILSEETAAAMRKMMTLVVTNGTAKTAQLNGYTSAGKTGTAQKLDRNTGTYSRRDYVASFVGFAPVESPVFTILVVADSPRGKIYGGDVAAPVFKRIAEQILGYRNVPTSLPVKATLMNAAWKGPKPGIADESVPEPPPDFDAPSTALVDEGGADSIASSGVNAAAGSAAMLSLDSGIAAPSFVGKTARAVAEQSQSDRLAVRFIGSGIAYRQSPLPGSSLPEGQKITVWFSVGGKAPQSETAARIEVLPTNRQPSLQIPHQIAAKPALQSPTAIGEARSINTSGTPGTKPAIEVTAPVAKPMAKPAAIEPSAKPASRVQIATTG